MTHPPTAAAAVLGALCAAALIAAAPASGTSLEPGPLDRARGAGNGPFMLGDASFSFTAESDPYGSYAAGHVRSSGDPDGAGPVPPFTAEGDVTCLRVEGRRAVLRWRLTRATGSAAPFQGGGTQSYVEDNGRPRAGRPVDRAGTDMPQPAATFRGDDCDDPSTKDYRPLNSGDVIVRDVPPAALLPPAITQLRAKPSTFCARKTKGCPHPGTTVLFTLSTDARVRADIRPRKENRGSLVEFVKRFEAGRNSVRLSDTRLTPGRWTLRLQGTNWIGSGGIAVTDVRVVRR